MKTMIVMRGLPWTGKSYRAKELAKNHGQILSTDEYWYRINCPEKPEEYSFDARLLKEAHQWNILRAKKLIEEEYPLILIDNTNIAQSQFCCNYFLPAANKGYVLQIEEPTSDRWNEIRILLRNKWENSDALKNWAIKLAEGSKETHNVPVVAIERMMFNWESDLTPEEVLENCKKNHKTE